MATNFGAKFSDQPLFVALTFPNWLEYCKTDERLYSNGDRSTSFIHMVNVGSVDPDITRWQSNFWEHRQKLAYPLNISEFYWGRYFNKFPVMVNTWVGMIKLAFVWRSLNGRCYGNQLNWGEGKTNFDWYHLKSLRWRSATDWNIVS